MDGAARLLGQGLMGLISKLFGRDSEDALSVPAMDGVFKPNRLLDAAEAVLELPGIANLAAGPDALYCSSGKTLLAIDAKAGRAAPLRTFGGPVTAIAASPFGKLAVGVEGSGLELFEQGAWRRFDLPAECAFCITAGVFLGEADLYLTIGSKRYPASEWKRDLMSRGSSGALIHCRLSAGTHEVVRDDMAFPFGVAAAAEGVLAVSESWRHRILALPIGQGAAASIPVSDLPAYPARLAPAADGGLWLALFAPRRQLTEFVLSEDDYRLEMMATIPPGAWIGPDFGDSGDDEQPLQAGSVRQMGIIKPWGPSRSYGLVAKLDRDMRLAASFHSRADGRRHGIASVAEFGGQLHAASQGSGTLLRIATGGGGPA